MSIYFVLRHKPTGRLLPARVCATQWDFDTPDGVYEPRLFNTARAARNCATCWGHGPYIREQVTESEGWEHGSYTYMTEPYPAHGPRRNRDDLEVLECRLELLAVLPVFVPKPRGTK